MTTIPTVPSVNPRPRLRTKKPERAAASSGEGVATCAPGTAPGPDRRARRRDKAGNQASLSESGEGPHPDHRAPTRRDQLLDLLRQETGASLAEIMQATGWQAHSARAALSTLRKAGHAVERSADDTGTRYRLAGGDGDA